ncbi:hypothetical protein PG997_000093 [Apiospora hydei]|uniref:Uncharacterized protein n=1 Tax=Apiospora hydei TaxID=1337664 RepID=A0ABR1X9X9_9PEZI
MSQTPYQDQPQEPQHSAMFEALATTGFQYDDICGLLPNQQCVPPYDELTDGSSGSATAATGQEDETSEDKKSKDKRSEETDDVPYSERNVEGDNDESKPVKKPWWGVTLKWTGSGSRPVMYSSVPQ